MNIFAAFALVALGIALSETYAAVRLHAERAAYERGYKQAQREQEIRDDAIDEYAITTPRRLDAYQADGMQEWSGKHAYSDVSCPVEATKPTEALKKVSQPFVDHMQANGQATVWLNKKEGQA